MVRPKPKNNIEEFCQEFYDSQIFHTPVIAGKDITSLWWETVYDNVVEADHSFANIDPTLFRREMTAIRLEMFSMALANKFKNEKHCISQSIFTRLYLEKNEKLELWDIMGEYNQAIAQSLTMTADGKQMGAGRLAQADKSRADMFYRWCKDNIADPQNITEQEKGILKCVAHAANRVGADVKRNDCILVRRLAARLASRLGCDINLKREALFGLGTAIFGLYKGAEEAIRD